MDLVERAREFAIGAHTRIDHRRKYTRQPYDEHLASVARLVASVTDDPEMVAAAWCHDVVEDTPATLYDVENALGPAVAGLVDELTDISRPSDGNRKTRKAIDRRHLAQSSPRAKTIKLADLTDNCRDICQHDPGFARVFLAEMDALLAVLTEGDPQLYRQARNAHDRCAQRLSREQPGPGPEPDSAATPWRQGTDHPHLVRLFTEAFTAQHIAVPLRSFDVSASCDHVAEVMDAHGLEVVCLREQGEINGYLRRADLGAGRCGEHMRRFRDGQVIDGESSLSDVIHILTLQQYGFIAVLGGVAGYFSRSDINKPVVRMWLFGVISLYEMGLVQLIDRYFPNDSWQAFVAPTRLEKARELQRERERRSRQSRLIDCLQFSDKAQIMIEQPQAMTTLGLSSRRTAKQLVKDLESLRNHLAHAQDIVSHDWIQIIRIAQRMAELSTP